MPHAREPLPRALKGEAFTVAQGRSIGLGQTRLRGSDLERPFRGVRIARESESLVLPNTELDLLGRCAALLLTVPDGAFFSHLTAARLWPLPLPRTTRVEPIHVSVRAPARPPRRDRVAGHLVKDSRVASAMRRGLPVVDPASMFCQLATELSRHDLVAVGDALVLAPVYPDRWDERPWVPLPQLEERVDMFRGRGKRLAGEALALIRPGAESRPESLLRLAIGDAGLPEPEVNPNLYDARGRFLGRCDLVYRRWKVIVEYDGEQHRTDNGQFDHDVIRLERLARAGWAVVRIVGRAFWADRDACMARIRNALIEGGWSA